MGDQQFNEILRLLMFILIISALQGVWMVVLITSAHRAIIKAIKEQKKS